MSIISELVEGGKRSEVEDHPWLFNKFEVSLPDSRGKGHVDFLLEIRRSQSAQVPSAHLNDC